MRAMAIASLSVVLIAADAPPSVAEPSLPLDNPAYSAPATAWESIEDAVAGYEGPESLPEAEHCRDRITTARKEAGKPPLLDPEPAAPDKPHHIYAVDRRQDGCAVMVMKGDPADIRPLPAPPDGPLLIMPLGSGR